MAQLIDLVAQTEKVRVGDADLTVKGVSAAGVAVILARFPEIRALMSGREVEVEQLMAVGGEAVAAVIAAGCGFPGDEQAEAVAGSLSVDAQIDILEAIMRLTMPKGIGPFVEKLAALGAIGQKAEASAKAPATKSRKSSTS